MLPEREISSSFLRYKFLFSFVLFWVVATIITTLTREFSPIGSPIHGYAGQALLTLFIGQVLLVIASYFWFNSSLLHLIKLQNEQFQLVSTDPTTGALTRRYFLSYMKTALAKTKDAQLGYLHLDMDNLKVINDTLGHNAGDAALARLVKVLRRTIPEGTIGRLGGDEFAVLVPDLPSREALDAKAEAILAGLRKPDESEGRALRLSATIGSVLAPFDGDDVQSLTTKADLALYAGKQSGRGKVVPFDDEMSAEENYARFIERELRGALNLGHLDVFYQPIVDIKGQDSGSYEALVRWQHQLRGFISPADFIPIAERSTLIDRISDFVLARVCRDIPSLGAMSVSVNISLTQLRRRGFCERFLAILAEHKVSPALIMIEITENLQLTSDAIEKENLEALIAAGIRIAIDDFGSGATSLDYLRRLNFYAIKIDRSYITNIAHDAVGMALVAAICSIGRALDIRVVAEGVETDEQFRLLQAAGCTHLQGYLFGKPRALFSETKLKVFG